MFPGIALLAEITRKGPLASVHPLMGNKVSFRTQAFLTDVAHKGPFTSVSSFVPEKPKFITIAFGAESAGMGLFIMMLLLVFSETMSSSEPFLANTAHVGHFTGVQTSFMREEAVFTSEAFGAESAGMGPLASVRSRVVEQV